MEASLVPQNSYMKDPETGFIMPDDRLKGCGMVTSDGVMPEQSFTGSLKTALIALLPKLWPNVSKACYQIGISKSTFKNHYMADPLFAQMVDEASEARIDHVEDFSVRLASERAGAVIDRMATLRANRPGKYDPARVIKLETSGIRISEEEAGKRMAGLRNVVDAEIVKDAMIVRDNKIPE